MTDTLCTTPAAMVGRNARWHHPHPYCSCDDDVADDDSGAILGHLGCQLKPELSINRPPKIGN